MAQADWQDILQYCMANGILIKRGVKEKLLEMDNPMSIVEKAEPGFLKLEDFGAPVKVLDESPADLARVIAPLVETAPVPVFKIHGLADYNMDDFPMKASDASSDIEVHWEITGNSVTEGRSPRCKPPRKALLCL